MNIDLKAEKWPIEQLIPRPTNPRTHSPEQVDSDCQNTPTPKRVRLAPLVRDEDGKTSLN